jgi:hypothetical protein
MKRALGLVVMLTIAGCAAQRSDGDVGVTAAGQSGVRPTEAPETTRRPARCHTHSIGGGQTLTECSEGS